MTTDMLVQMEERACSDERNEVSRFISMYLGIAGDSEYKKGRRDAMEEVANFLKSRTVICNHSGYAETDAAELKPLELKPDPSLKPPSKPLKKPYEGCINLPIEERLSAILITVNAIVDVVNEMRGAK